MKINKNIISTSFLLWSRRLLRESSVNKKTLKVGGFQLLVVTFSVLTSFSSAIAQDDKEKQKILKESQELLSDASFEMNKDNFPLAEANYRRAIALNPKEETGKYNLGTAYYDREMNATAMHRFKQAAAIAVNKNEKHQAFHNLGNTFMNEKKYREAVESFKSALRNNPIDDETRYNLALAKKLLEDQEKNGGGDDDKDDKEDQKENEEKKENEDNNKKEGDDGDKKDEDDKGEEEEDKKEGDENEDKGKPDEPKDEKENKQPPPPVPGKLSPQQVKNLLEAMNNEEKKVQEKINAKKQKGEKIKSEKDW